MRKMCCFIALIFGFLGATGFGQGAKSSPTPVKPGTVINVSKTASTSVILEDKNNKVIVVETFFVGTYSEPVLGGRRSALAE